MSERMFVNDKLNRIYELSMELEGLLKNMPASVFRCKRMGRIRRLYNMINKPTPVYCDDDCPACFKHRMVFEYSRVPMCECKETGTSFMEYLPKLDAHVELCAKCEKPVDFQSAELVGQNVLPNKKR